MSYYGYTKQLKEIKHAKKQEKKLHGYFGKNIRDAEKLNIRKNKIVTRTSMMPKNRSERRCITRKPKGLAVYAKSVQITSAPETKP
jgi:hypothetical protein